MSRHYSPIPGPAGERRVRCDYCGLTWYRSDCVRDEAGMLACPDDASGRVGVTLDRLNAQGAARAARKRPIPPGSY